MSGYELFIRRPVATTLLTLAIVLAGLAAFRLLPVSPLPQVDYPTISVSASLPGASPEVMAATVATPLERALGTIAGVTEMTSNSSLGQTRIVLQFDLNRKIEAAANDVQAAINAARAGLPSGLVRNPTYRKVNPADAPIMIVALTSDTMTQGQLYDVASTVLAQRLSQVSGVGQVSVGGSSLPAVRVQVNPTQLDRYGIGIEAVRTAIAAANANRPKGSVSDGERHWQIGANDQSLQVADYVPLIVAYRNGSAVRLADVATVRESVEDERNAGSANGKPSVLLIINREPAANIIDTVDRIYDVLPALRSSVPATVELDVVMDRTPTIRASLREVERTLMISVALVVMVVFLFLRKLRATLIPAVAVPTSLIGTFGVMYLAGYTLDNLSLMALTIATGFVVDDAIVVLENIARRVEAGEPPMQAAIHGVREVGFTVVAISLSLIAVFIPILAMGGIVGRLFREFAVVLSVAILISMLISLTTTPMLCARWLRPTHAQREGWLARAGRRGMERLTAGYARSLGWALDHGWLMLLVLAATIALNVWLYAIVPKGFFPQQDTGRLMGFIRADQSISFQAMRGKLASFIEIVRRDPAVSTVTGFTGGSRVNSGQMFITLKPLAEREPAEKVIARLRAATARVPGASLFMFPVQDIRVGGRQSSSQFQYTLQADDLQELRTWEPRIRAALSRLPELVDIDTDQEDRGLQTTLTIDRDAAAQLGIATRQVSNLLNNAYGQRQVSTIYAPLNQYHVVLEVAPSFRTSPGDLNSLNLPNAQGSPVPLSAIAKWGPTTTPLGVSHQGQFAASTISFNLAEGYALSDATVAIQDTMSRIGVPTTLWGSFEGTAGSFQRSMASQPYLILLALITVYIVLGMLYESLIHPVTILSTLPSAGVGALLALIASGTEFSLMALIAVMLLIGIVKKNAILMIDFALAAERNDGLSPREAIHRACRLRFRPILMTTMA
ncbi:MAG: efflux RND transporter permease subunit, partial [Burkholderiaceae bacterium]